MITCEEKFVEIYNREPLQAFCPYRVCPLGAHIDHQFGRVHGFALNYGVHMAYGIKRGGIVELVSLNFPKRVQFHVNDVSEVYGSALENHDGTALANHVWLKRKNHTFRANLFN